MNRTGTFGVITEVSLKIRPIPTIQKYGSMVFPDFEWGLKFMREVARQVYASHSMKIFI